MIIRKAVPEDAPEVAELLIEAAHGFIEDSMGGGGEKLHRNIFKHSGGFMNYKNCFIAEADGKTAGMMMIYSGAQKKEGNMKNTILFLRYLSLSLLSHLGVLLRSDTFPFFSPKESELYLHGIAVYPSFRSRGVGRALLAHLDNYGKELGLTNIMLAAETNNTRAIELYQREGYSIEGDGMSFQTKVKNYYFYRLSKNI